MEKMTELGLPEAFVLKMQTLLGDEAKKFFESYDDVRRYGLRLNPLKCGGEIPEYVQELKRIPWAAEGYYYDETMRPGKHPFHEAGVYYIQEPSAMAVAEALEPKSGERILDLCAAPGGKSTHLAGKMAQKGLLVCNEIHPQRAKILAQNVERMGISNAVVTNMEPAGLVDTFRGFFDGIVVDAPCSGEGMFRKDENARSEWSPDHVTLCANRQDGILDCAAEMLRYGGRIAYSTCTFSPEENEQAVARFLERHPEFHVEVPVCAPHFSAGHADWAGGCAKVEKTVRIWPHKVDGEGHFLALLVKGERSEREMFVEEVSAPVEKKAKSGKKGGKNAGKNAGKSAGPDLGDFYSFCEDMIVDQEWLAAEKKFLTFGDNLYLVPAEMPEMAGLKVLRPGLHVGTLKKGRLEPSHALALFLKKEDVKRSLEIGSGEQAEKYLKGETLTIPEEQSQLKGWVLVTVEGYSIGFGKADRGVLKNHYPKGLRKP
ncbi:MAG: RsmF rRNA methyltransferase first C-terminal domain-containing protein [Lachnospiraceae bacterium]|nr:RsmF rRNA methyltransferase first C-terminal domain-containing protein [Lachnospiraceae bacterium]